jgi:hypothetical protein
MIALCREHHDAADAGAYTREQLHEMKAKGRGRAKELGARFEWMRHRLLVVVGGSFFYEVPIAVQLRDEPVIWFGRDEHQRLLLNVNMPSATHEPRMRVDNNFWLELGAPASLECPPSGKLVSVTYPNGDALRVEFFEVDNGDALSKRFKHTVLARRYLETEDLDGFPVTAVDIRMRLMHEGKAVIDFDAQETRIGGMKFIGTLVTRSGGGFRLG